MARKRFQRLATMTPAGRLTGWLAASAAVALLGAEPAGAQTLPTTPIHGLAPLPAVPAQAESLPAASDAGAWFLKGRFLVGLNLSHSLTSDEQIGSHWRVGPIVRNTPRRLGWGPAFGFSWYRGDITATIGGQRTTVGEIRVRPVMAGASYTIGSSRIRASFSLVGGYAFTSAKVTAALPPGVSATVDIRDAWVARPNVGMTVAVARRLAIVGSAGYVYANPRITLTLNQPAGMPASLGGSFRSDYISLSVGMAVSIF